MYIDFLRFSKKNEKKEDFFEKAWNK